MSVDHASDLSADAKMVKSFSVLDLSSKPKLDKNKTWVPQQLIAKVAKETPFLSVKSIKGAKKFIQKRNS